MRRYRRLVVIDRLIPFLAALVGLLALAGAVFVQLDADAKTTTVTAAMAELKGSMEALGQRTEALALPENDGTIEALLALQDRMDRLEKEWREQKDAVATPAAASPVVTGEDAAPVQAATIDPSLPTKDCIPLGTRFMVTPNETFPICQSKAVVKTGPISADSVYIEGAGAVVETSFGTLPGTNCTVMIFSADESGFAEARVTCT